MYLRKCLLWTNAFFQSSQVPLARLLSFTGIRWFLRKEQSTGCADQSVGLLLALWASVCLSVTSLFHHFFCLNHHGVLDCSHSSQHDPLKMLQWLCISFRIKSRVLVMANRFHLRLSPDTTWAHLPGSLPPSWLPVCVPTCNPNQAFEAWF